MRRTPNSADDDISMRLFGPGVTVGDDVEIYTDDTRKEVLTTLSFLRQQMKKDAKRPNFCLADFIAPKASGIPYVKEH